MKRGLRTLCILLVFVLLLLISQSLVFANQIEILNNGQILSDQDLSFQTCVDGNSIKHSLYCADNGQSLTVPAIQYVDNCVVSTVDLSTFTCNQIDISATYLSNGISRKLTETVFTKKTLSNPQTILNKQEWDGGWGTPSDTGYAIWILSRYSPDYDKQIDEGLEWLKLQRKESAKCWTSANGQCNLYQTARTLAFLEFAGFNFSEKIYQDGVNWVESQINYIEDDDWELQVVPQSNGNCTIKYGTKTLYNDVVEDGEKLSFPITATYESLINVTCPDMAEKVTIYDAEGKNIFYNEYEDNSDEYFDYTIVEEDDDYTVGDDSLFRIPPSCWSSTEKWDFCHRETTLYASLLPEVTKDKRDNAREWLEDELRSGDIVGEYLSTTNSIADTAMYLYAFDNDNDDVRAWLIHKQNNDGSWGSGSNQVVVKSTGYALLALRNQTFSGSDIVMSDGISWLSGSYPSNGWETFEQDAISFIILRDTGEQRVKANPSPVKINGKSIKVNISNPTGFDLNNLSISFTNDLGSVVSVSKLSELSSYSSTFLTVNPKSVSAGFYSGSIIIRNDLNEIGEIPVTVTQDVMFEIEPSQDTVYFFSDIQNVNFNVKTNAEFNCQVSWSDPSISSRNTFTVSRDQPITLPTTITEFENKEVSGQFSCETSNSLGDSSYEIPFSFELKYYDVSPFDIKPSKISIKGVKNGTVTIENNLDDDFRATLQFVEQPLYLTLEKSTVEVPAGESVKVKILNLAFPIANITSEEDVTLEVKALGETELIPVSLYVPPLGESGGILGKIIIFVVLLAGLGGGYYYYEYVHKKQEQSETKPKVDFKKKLLEFKSDVREVLPPALQKYVPKSKAEIAAEKEAFHKELQKTHLKDMVVVMKKMDKTDKEIIDKLHHEGLSEDEIQDLIKMVSLEEEIDSNIKQEEDTLGILETISENADTKSALQKKGFTPDSIKKALEELKTDVTKKEDELKKQAGKKEEY